MVLSRQWYIPRLLAYRFDLKMGEEVSAEYLAGHNQHSASLKIDLKLQSLLSEALSREGDVREIARFASVSLPGSHAGDWLTTVPSPSLGLLLKPQEFIAALRYRLGHPVYSRDGPCPACGQPSDRLGDHSLNCTWHG